VSEIASVDPLGPERSEAALAAAARALRDGGLVVLPTETVYGIACRPDDPRATARLFDAKARPRGLNLAVLATSADEALALVERTPFVDALAAALWPGPLTMVLPRGERTAAWALGEEGGTVGLRVPDLPLARALLARTGPLAVTSANRSGEPPAATTEELLAAFGDEVAVYLTVEAGAATGSGEPSTVIDLTDPPRIRLLRAGALTGEHLAAALDASAAELEWVDFPSWR
jgi:tRNA threonylcarbamoyl adenosine modification protein (Sua5/YciO/YrdC/YwlC family)